MTGHSVFTRLSPRRSLERVLAIFSTPPSQSLGFTIQLARSSAERM